MRARRYLPREYRRWGTSTAAATMIWHPHSNVCAKDWAQDLLRQWEDISPLASLQDYTLHHCRGNSRLCLRCAKFHDCALVCDRWLCSLEAVILEDDANASTSTNVNVMMTGIIVASAAAAAAIINHCLFLCEEELVSWQEFVVCVDFCGKIIIWWRRGEIILLQIKLLGLGPGTERIQ